VFEKQSELYELSRREVGHWQDLCERTTNDATRQVEQLNELLKKEQSLTGEAKARIDQLMNTTARLYGQLNSLGQANTSAIGPTGIAGPIGGSGGGISPAGQWPGPSTGT
jgi:hypothetical protein